MIKYYLKSAWNNLAKNKTHSTINILGLAIGCATFVLIVLYVHYEKSYDKFFDNSNRIYRAYMEYKVGETFTPGDAQTYNQTGPALKESIPEIIEYARYRQLNLTSISYNRRVLDYKFGYIADPACLDIFDYKFIEGNRATALDDPNSIILTKSIADALFRKESPIGKTIQLYWGNRKVILSVTGVMEDLPEQTHFKIDYLLPFQICKELPVATMELDWNNNNYYTFLLTEENVNVNVFRKKVQSYDIGYDEERHNIECIEDIHLYSNKPYEAEINGSGSRVKFLMGIAIIVIILSWLNYVNLSVTNSIKRSKETGIRKTTGAKSFHIFRLFMTETFMVNFVAFAGALVLVNFLLPVFSAFSGKNLEIGTLGLHFYLMLAGIIFISGLLAGLYPAILLSKIKPHVVLKGNIIRSSNSVDIRKIMVVAQFAATIVLLVGTISINKQIKFIKDQPIGVDLNKVLSIGGSLQGFEGNISDSYGTLKAELKKIPGVSNIATCDDYPGQLGNQYSYGMYMELPSGEVIENITWYYNAVDEDYIQTMDIEILSGRTFIYSDQQREKVIINERAARLMGFDNYEDAIGKQFYFWGQNRTIVGVNKNVNFMGFKSKNVPMILAYHKNVSENMLVKLDQSVLSVAGVGEVLKKIEKSWYSVFPNSIYHYKFIDKEFARFYDEDIKFNKAFILFTILAMMIAMLGLYSLASYICMTRIKEIGVRKINGAKMSEILAHLNKNFAQWILTACVIAVPIAYYAIHTWLNNFTHKTSLNWWIFILAGGIALIVALLTVSWQSWRAANRNPVEALRYE